MGKYNNIAIIYGSDSSEWEISCRSGEFVASRIDVAKYDVYEIFARFGKWQLVSMKKKDAIRVPSPKDRGRRSTRRIFQLPFTVRR